MSRESVYGSDHDSETNLNINSIFEMLPDNGRIVVLADRDKNRTWTQGKMVTVADVVGDRFYTMNVFTFTKAIDEWEKMNNTLFDAMSLTEQDALEILKIAIKCKKKKG